MQKLHAKSLNSIKEVITHKLPTSSSSDFGIFLHGWSIDLTV